MSTYQLVNLTPHPVTLRGRMYQPSGSVARLEERGHVRWIQEGRLRGKIPYRVVDDYTITNLPEPTDEKIIYMVSRPVAQAAKRPDVAALDKFVRDWRGLVIGAEGLVTFSAEGEENNGK